MLGFDLETDGLLENVSKIHCVSMRHRGDATIRFVGEAVKEAIETMVQHVEHGGQLVAFNGIKYDYPVIEKLYGVTFPRHARLDSMVMAAVVWPDTKGGVDQRLKAKGKLPGHLVGRNSLEAWGYRLGKHKGEYTKWCKENGIENPWAEYRPEMGAYCDLDVDVQDALLDKVAEKDWPVESMVLEHRVAEIIAGQERFGIHFNEQAAAELYQKLVVERITLERKLAEQVGLVCRRKGPIKTPKVPNKPRGYEAGVPFSPVIYEPFNPSSRQQCANVLINRWGWKPTAFTPKGHPQVDEKSLEGLPYPIVPDLLRLLLLEKRIGQLAEGNEAWLKKARKGVMYGRVATNGAVTGRATHFSPNIAQVPKVGSFLGEECRALFGPPPGYVQLGTDLEGIELRCLAHYMAVYDGGAYAKAVVEGKQEDESDVHSLNCKALGFEPKRLYVIHGKQVKGRDIAKTFIYAFLYGAGDMKLGSIVGKGRKRGAELRAAFLAGLPALDKLIRKVKRLAKKQGWLPGLDGRRIPVRSEHAALNTLLQSAGALISKMWMVCIHDHLERIGGFDVHQMLWIHDELQFAVSGVQAPMLGDICVHAAKQAGEEFGFRVPVGADFKIGTNWKECH